MKKVITFGTFDVLHIGHLNILEHAAGLGDELIVGVSSDALNLEKKSRLPVYNQEERLRIINALSCVNHVFLEESLEEKSQYLKDWDADILVMGDDWRGKFDHLATICEVLYLPRTPSISTTVLIEKISKEN